MGTWGVMLYENDLALDVISQSDTSLNGDQMQAIKTIKSSRLLRSAPNRNLETLDVVGRCIK